MKMGDSVPMYVTRMLPNYYRSLKHVLLLPCLEATLTEQNEMPLSSSCKPCDACFDDTYDVLQITKHLPIAEPQHRHPQFFQVTLPRGIRL